MAQPATAPPVVIVAGGTGGIGSAVCERLAGSGWHVVSAARGHTEAPSPQTAGRIHRQACDVTSEDECRALVRSVLGNFGRVDAVVYAAIGYHRGSPEEHDSATITQVFAANVFGAHLLSSACFTMAMKDAGGGSICFLGSTAGSLALPGRAAYCASKAALSGLTRALAIDWAYANVRVNCVTTAYVATELETAGAESGEWGHDLADVRRRVPLGRLAEPQEIAAAVAWVIGAESPYVSGSELVIDGAWSAWAGFGTL
jgi:3-oxoacyl-[acyl-carrier protein] reductase